MDSADGDWVPLIDGESVAVSSTGKTAGPTSAGAHPLLGNAPVPELCEELAGGPSGSSSRSSNLSPRRRC